MAASTPLRHIYITVYMYIYNYFIQSEVADMCLKKKTMLSTFRY